MRSLVIYCVLAGMFAGAANAESFVRVGPDRQTGDATIYYDVASDGAVLRIDYATGVADVLFRLPLQELGPIATVSGRFHAGCGIGVFFVAWRGHQLMDVYYGQAEGAVCAPVGLSIDPNADVACALTPEGILYIQYNSREDFRLKREVYALPTAKMIGRFGEDIDLREPWSTSSDGSRIHIYERKGNTIITYQAREARVLKTLSLSDLVGGPPHPGIPGVHYMNGDYALAGSRPRRLVSIEEEKVVQDCAFDDIPDGFSTSYPRTIFVHDGDWSKYLIAGNRLSGDGTLEESGQVLRMQLKDGAFRKDGIIAYDPQTEVVLLDESQHPVVLKKHVYDYVSMTDMTSPNWRLVMDWDGREAIVEEKRDEILRYAREHDLPVKPLDLREDE